MTDIHMRKFQQNTENRESLPCGCVVLRTASSNKTMNYHLVSCNKDIDCSLFKWRKDAADAMPKQEVSKLALFLAEYGLKVPNV